METKKYNVGFYFGNGEKLHVIIEGVTEDMALLEVYKGATFKFRKDGIFHMVILEKVLYITVGEYNEPSVTTSTKRSR